MNKIPSIKKQQPSFLTYAVTTLHYNVLSWEGHMYVMFGISVSHRLNKGDMDHMFQSSSRLL